MCSGPLVVGWSSWWVREDRPEEGEVAKLLREQVQGECGSSDEEEGGWSNLTSEELQVKLS